MNGSGAFARPRVSILMPCRDAAPYLAAAIQSIEAQTFGACEVIAVDDGSRDGTAEMLRAWQARDARVAVISTPPRGIVPALQLAASRAQADFLARMDADDVSHSERIERQVRTLTERSELAACGTQVRYVPRGAVRDGARRYERWINGLIEPPDLALDIFVECPIAHPTLMVRRDRFVEVGGYRDVDWPEDYDLVLRLWRSGGRLANVPSVLLDWRESPTRLSRTDMRYSAEAFRACRIHHLHDRIASAAGVVIWGAGPVGKAYSHTLRKAGHELRAFVDIDPRKIGQTVHGVAVIEPADLRDYRDAFLLAAVAGAVPRGEIRAALASMGWREPDQFVAVA